MKYVLLFLLLVPLSSQSKNSKNLFESVLKKLSPSISPQCQQQFQQFVENLNKNETSWAQKMLDATSRVPVGSVTLNFDDLGDFEKCIGVESSDVRVYGKYCLGQVSFSNESKLRVRDTIDFLAPIWAMCLPDGCSTTDTNFIGTVVLNDMLEDEGIRVTFSDILCQTVKETEPELSTTATAAMYVILALLLIAVLSCTLYEICGTFDESKWYSPTIKAFSAYNNSKSVFKLNKRNPSHLPCLDGIRCLSMMWIVIFHQYRIPMFNAITNTQSLVDWPYKIYSIFIISGGIAVDTFLTIGGTLMSYCFMKAREKKTPFNLLQYYLHRYLRLTASLAIVILVSATLLEYIGSGPRWPYLTLAFQKNCEDNWWSTLLYVQNYVNPQKMCVGQSWYTSVDMQLCLISPPIFFALWKYPKLGLSVLGLCGLASMGTSFYEISYNTLPGVTFGLYGDRSKSYEYQKRYYLLTHTRATPWIIGVVLGYVIFKIHNKQKDLRINKYTLCSMWLVCLGTMLACTIGLTTVFPTRVYNVWTNASYAAFARPAWSLAISWIILACSTKNGGVLNWFLSLPIFQVCNKFTYSIYLTHVTILYAVAYNRKSPMYFSGFDTAVEFWATLCLNGGVAILVVLLAECPIFEMEKILIGKGNKKLKQQDTDGTCESTSFRLEKAA